MMQKTLTRTLPALVWALTLVALAAAALFALGDASAQQPPISASIVDDTDQNTNSLCGGFVWSDGHCDLRIRVTDHDATDSQATIVVSPIFSGAFDASVITPDDSALSSQALGPNPATYTIPGNAERVFRLRMTPVVTASGSQYYQGYVRVHLGPNTSGKKLAEYKLTLQKPTPTSVTSESITSTSFAVRWKMDERARQTIIFWRPRDDGGAIEESVKVTMVQNEKYRLITGLQPSTCYVARVQPLLNGKSLEPAQIEVATLADPGATDPPADPCAPPPKPSPCTTSGDYDVDDDGLIEVCSLQQLDAIRHDLDGDGVPDINPHPPNVPADFTWDGKTQVESTETNYEGILKTYMYARGDFSDAERQSQYAAAYPSPDAGMGCPTSGCKGYELAANLDFDTNRNGMIDDGDEYWNNGKGWIPIIGQTYRVSVYRKDGRYGIYRFFGGSGREVGSNVPVNLEKMFRAVFEGNGRTIANLYINDPGTPRPPRPGDRGISTFGGNHFNGLFGYVGRGGHIRNVGLIVTPGSNSNVNGANANGTLVGALEFGTVSGSYSHVPIHSSWGGGGLIGYLASWGQIIESYARGDITSTSKIGGLVGHLWNGDIKASFASGDMSSDGDGWRYHGGGLVGYRDEGTITASYASGDVTIDTPRPYGHHVGGLVATLFQNWGSNQAYVQASYSTGSVPPVVESRPRRYDSEIIRDRAGGLLGACSIIAETRERQKGNIKHSYWDTDTSGHATGICGTGYTTTELQAPTGYTGIYSAWNLDIDGDNTPDDPWDFGTASEYPILDYCAAKPGIDLSWDTTRTEYCPLREATQHGRALGKR